MQVECYSTHLNTIFIILENVVFFFLNLTQLLKETDLLISSTSVTVAEESLKSLAVLWRIENYWRSSIVQCLKVLHSDLGDIGSILHAAMEAYYMTLGLTSLIGVLWEYGGGGKWLCKPIWFLIGKKNRMWIYK